jgi:hypothetical protein
LITQAGATVLPRDTQLNRERQLTASQTFPTEEKRREMFDEQYLQVSARVSSIDAAAVHAWFGYQ